MPPALFHQRLRVIVSGRSFYKDPNYTPLWQVSQVTWNSGTAPYVLKSEEDVLNAQSAGLVTIVKTNIVVNCPVIYTPYGGLLPKAKIIGGHNEDNE